MFYYILRRILIALPTLFIIVTLVFFAVRVLPGDPAMAALGEFASQEALTAFRDRMGLDLPILTQYFKYLSNLAHLDLGKSMFGNQSISRMVWQVLPYSLELTVSGLLIGVVLALPGGIISAVKRNGLIDYLLRIGMIANISAPAFYLALILLLAFSYHFDLLPSVGGGNLNDLPDTMKHLTLPAVTLGLIMMSFLGRAIRSSILEVLPQQFVQTAKAKGLKESVVLYKHILRNALIPITTLVGSYFSILLGGSVMTEIVYNRPGLGRLLVGAVTQRDYTLLQSLIIVFAIFVILTNLITDIIYGWIDPRIRYD